MLTPGIVAVALGVLERRGHWLIQLRDDSSTIVAPGCWGLFGGHMEAGETPEQSLRRELIEEIGYAGGTLTPWFRSAAGGRVRHVFRVALDVELEHLRLQEGQDMVLVSLDELGSGRVWSPRLAQHRPLAPSLQEALDRQLRRHPGRSR
jgi:8-oxo-dGTP pyrophosphatase MutT (NUDIX family)